MNSSQELAQAAQQERQAARIIDLRGYVPLLVMAVIFYVGYLVFPHTAGIRGYEVVAGLADVSLMEQIFVYGTTVGMAATVATLVTRKTTVGWIAWMLVGFSFFVALWAVWALGTRGGAGLGFYLGLIADLLALIGFSRVAMRKSPAQLAAQERMRVVASQLDEVGRLQTELQDTPAAAENPLLIDDRRAQAAERHRRQRPVTDSDNGA